MSGDRVYIGQMEAMTLFRILDLWLLKEEHAKMHVGVEIDVHGYLELIDVQIFNFLATANRMVIN